jgi:hypothetical protein
VSNGVVSPIPAEDVLCLVATATTLKAVPDDLAPPLETANADYGLPTEAVCVADISVVELPDCVFGDPSGAHSVVMYGDSNAAMWLPAFDQIGKRAHWKVTLLAKSACIPGYISTFNTSKKVEYSECDRWHDYAIARINRTNPDLVVVISSSGGLNAQGEPISKSAWQAALIKTLKLITVPDSRKVVVANLPYPLIGNPPNQITGPDCLAAHLDNVQFCSATRDVAVGWTSQVESRAAAAAAGAHFIDVNPWFCAGDICPAVIGKMNVYVHNGHLSATYATYVSGALQVQLEPILNAP